ncbi:helix-turn-helix transcriptional regulator [Paenibacillus cymbidii]|uniref:helix-turn-helix transcriptional regulator n=1 Tax=Paenibacillus cymbidii TaxID=1639034 RepID=UPI0014367FE2|nr:AraC family transcriptional regulator [Paenibacillus cymbidii]
MVKLASLANRTKSHYIRLIAGFLLIVMLLIGFNFMSFAFFQKAVYREIIKYNNLNLKHTVDNYESYLVLIRNMLLSESGGTNVIALGNSPDMDFWIANQIRLELEQIVTNPFLYLDNVIIHMKDKSYVIQKNNVIAYQDFMQKYYRNDRYSPEFWRNELEGNFLFHIYPAAEFADFTFASDKQTNRYIPIIVNNRYATNLTIMAFLDAEKLHRAFHHSINDKLIIIDDDNRIIFASDRQDQSEILPVFTPDSAFKKKGDSYYFYQQGASSRLTYINIIPIDYISSQIFHLKMIFYSLLAVSVIVGFLLSLWMTNRFHLPIKKILEAIQNTRSNGSIRTKIKEFDLIHTKISEMMLANDAIQEDLSTTNSIVQHYAYINKLKKIRMNGDKNKDLHFADKPFVLVLFKLIFKPNADSTSEINEERAVSHYRELVYRSFSERYTDSHTLQLEHDQILSVLFLQEGISLITILQQMKQVFDIDRDYLSIAIAVSPAESHSSQLTVAYQRVSDLIERRRLSDGAQIIVTAETKHAPFVWTGAQEHQFLTRLLYGNAEDAIEWIDDRIDHLQEEGASAVRLFEFSESAVAIVKKEMQARQLRMEEMAGEISERIKRCHTPEELKLLLGTFVRQAKTGMEKREKNPDPIIRFVTEHLNDHLDTDVSLDWLAEKLNLSAGYLSTYFKEKTGSNYLEYVNQLRIDRAKLLLQSYNMRIQQISEKIGYTNVNSFIRMFKKYTGITPGEYRKKIGLDR